ncbi:MAG: PaaI family thioesterase [Alphaproteobacteria bacterium]|nr:PaaI family thioesterase [Alphaproteobacteria bacterium]
MPYKVLMDAQEVADFLDQVFPQTRSGGRIITIKSISPGEAVVHFRAGEDHLRPGGTVSGPTLFTLADLAAYAVILGHIGPKALAVTTNLNINFMRKPEPGTLIGKVRLLKLGKRLAVTDCEIRSEGSDDILAHATATYSLPADRS